MIKALFNVCFWAMKEGERNWFLRFFSFFQLNVQMVSNHQSWSNSFGNSFLAIQFSNLSFSSATVCFYPAQKYICPSTTVWSSPKQTVFLNFILFLLLLTLLTYSNRPRELISGKKKKRKIFLYQKRLLLLCLSSNHYTCFSSVNRSNIVLETGTKGKKLVFEKGCKRKIERNNKKSALILIWFPHLTKFSSIFTFTFFILTCSFRFVLGCVHAELLCKSNNSAWWIVTTLLLLPLFSIESER